MSMTSEITEKTLTLRTSIAAPDELVWSYLSTAEGLACWQADSVHGDLTSGNFSLRWPELGARLDLSVGELELGRRIVLRAGATALHLTLDEGVLELQHHGLDSQDDLKGFESSWLTALALLELAATKHPRTSRRVSWLFEEVPASAELLHCYFTEAPALGTWLGNTGRDLLSNDSYELTPFGGPAWSGRVLYAERDVCLHVGQWNDGALAMRSLPGQGGARIAALGISTWNQPASDDLMETLQGALRRLATTTRRLDG